jgi:hypothetical protein
MTEAAKNITNLRPAEKVSQQNEALEPWIRQKNEPANWYMRFQVYLNLGPGRSLRKALASEPDQKATKSNKAQKKEGVGLSTLSVPGSWSRAAKVWNWVERAKAYDQAQIEKQAVFIRQVVTQQPFVSKAYRIIHLCSIAAAFSEYSKQGMSLEESIAYTKAMQSLLKDIAREMEGMDETTMMIADAYAHKHLIELANKTESKELSTKKDQALPRG